MKKKLTRYVILSFCMHQYSPAAAISMVYNFRMAEITKQPIGEKTDDKNHIVSTIVFDQWRKKYTRGIRQNFIGSLGTYIYDFEPYYFRIDAAFSHIQETVKKVPTFCDTETDDILFTCGRNFVMNNRSLLTLSGLFGIPTHKLHRLQHVDFGYSQVGIGAQIDGSYAFDKNAAFLYGARYVYFVPRNACDTVGFLYRFTQGNIGDLFVALKDSWRKHGLEVGASQRFRFGADICPYLEEAVEKSNFIRTSFYVSYKYSFQIQDIPSRLIVNISYGFDEKSKTFGNKYIATLWASWGVNF